MAGFFGFFDYTKPGKGVEKEDFKPNLSSYFRILTNRFWKLMQLNFITLVCSLPLLFLLVMFYPVAGEDTTEHVIGAYWFFVMSLSYVSVVGLGVVMPGLTYVLRNFSGDRHAWVWSDFFEHIKKNLRQSAVLMVIDLAVLYLVTFVYSFYSGVVGGADGALNSYQNMAFFARAFVVLAAGIYFMMHFYIYQIMVTFDMKLKQILKNSFIFTLAHLPRNVGILALVAVLAGLIFGFTTGIGLLVSVLIGVSLISYTVNFITRPVIERHMMPPAQEEEASGGGEA